MGQTLQSSQGAKNWLVLWFVGVGCVLVWVLGVALVLWVFVGVVAWVWGAIIGCARGEVYARFIVGSGAPFLACSVALLGFVRVFVWVAHFVRL
jgi:hypothetical protein